MEADLEKPESMPGVAATAEGAGADALSYRRPSGPHRIARSAIGLSILSFLGPLSGFLVELALGWRYGIGPLVDGYRVGLVFFLFAQSIAWGILPNLVVPFFSEVSRDKRTEEAWKAISGLGFFFLALGIGFAAAGSLFASSLARWFAPGLDPAGFATATSFVRSFSLAVLPLAWFGIMTGLFQCHGIFWVQPFAQGLYNLLLLGAILWTGSNGLILAPILGCFLIGLLFMGRLLPLAKQEGWPLWSAGRLSLQILGRFLKNGLPLFLTLGAGYAAVIFVTRATSLLASGSVASFGYAWKVLQLGLIVPGALATVLFPRMSDAWSAKEGVEFGRLWREGLRLMLFFSAPVVLLCTIFSRDLISVLLARGAFSGAAVEETGLVLAILTFSVPATAGTAFLQKAFYSRNETLFPSAVSVIGAILVMTCSEITARRFGLAGLAWLTPGIGWISFLWLAAASRSIGANGWRSWSRFVASLLVASAVAGWVAYGIKEWLCYSSQAGALLRLGVASVLSLATFVLLLRMLGLPEATRVLAYAGWQLQSIKRKDSCQRND
ncbi:murein biosynthesis integral membrane protein MurJ [Methylacidimicrobium tartarophylax]|uniref:Putative peptidoglycan lipid II flippase n=1 Tax=Methylacidimicrobium tartarophylax TaxID=1041768 RepID=A0A5E6MAC1_9BACT|nr:lipid II flippase MurJ [Methylacidimicrobium tartarophylax]VVM06492.1 putative peptidoglycan lipid II flippase [Methylacidimicrobium tartarophylax]